MLPRGGRANCRAYDRHVRAHFPEVGSVLEAPELVAEMPLAVDVAGWYWERSGLNALADRDDLEAITRAVNGGLGGLTERRRLLERGGRSRSVIVGHKARAWRKKAVGDEAFAVHRVCTTVWYAVAPRRGRSCLATTLCKNFSRGANY